MLLVIVYLFLLVIQIVLMVLYYKRLEEKIINYSILIEVMSIFVTYFLMNYYSNLPQLEFFAKLNFFNQISLNYIALTVFYLMLLVSIVIKFYYYFSKNKKK